MIDNITKDKILEAAQILDVVSDFVSLKRAGANYKGLCPFHDDRTPSFMVSPAKNYCKCFACGKGGSPVGFIMEHEQLSYPDALRWLAKKYGITIQERELTPEEKASQTERDSMFIVNEWANKWFQEQLHDTQEGRNIGLTYFRQRGFRDDIIRKFQLGFSPQTRDACTQAALKAGYQERFLISTPDATGIAHGVGISLQRDNGTLYDRFAGRVIFPIFSVSGKVVGFGGRVLDTATKGVNVKYQNSPESIIYHKKNELYGLFQAKAAIRKEDSVYMVEGYTDVLAMHQNGVENVVASSGTALTHEQILLIRRFTQNVVVLYDGDAAGIKASQRGIDMLLAEGMNVRLLLLPDGQDPDEFGRKHTAQEFQAYMKENQTDFIHFKTQLLLKEAQGDPIKISRLVNNIVQSIAVIPDEITRVFYVREMAQMMQLREELVSSAVVRQLKLNAEEQQKERERQTRRTQMSSQTSPAVSQTSPAVLQDLQSVSQDPQQTEASLPSEISQQLSAQAIAVVQGGSIQEASTPLSPDVQLSAPIDRPASQPPAIETLIIQAVIRYGERIICDMQQQDGSIRPVNVIQYVEGSLSQDCLTFTWPLYRQVLELGVAHCGEEDFKAESFYLNHPDKRIAELAFRLGTDVELLSRYHTQGEEPDIQQEYNLLMDLVTRLLTDLKLAIVTQRRRHLVQQMRDPAVLADRERTRTLMQQLQELKALEAVFAKQCGDRVLGSC